jgi:hypothetical protein
MQQEMLDPGNQKVLIPFTPVKLAANSPTTMGLTQSFSISPAR